MTKLKDKHLGLVTTLLVLPHLIASFVYADLKPTMRNNFQALMNLQPYASNPELFSDPKNKKYILEQLNILSQLKHFIPEKMKGQEPGLAAIARLFKEYVDETKSRFQTGSAGPATMHRVQTMTHFCMSCHTRVQSEQSFLDAQKKIESLSLTMLEKARFYAATRQFDKAVDAYKKVVSTVPHSIKGYRDLPQALREVLGITIRIKNDPAITWELLDGLSKRADIPEDFQRYIAEWKTDVRGWRSEKPLKKSSAASVFLQKAKKLIEQGRDKQLFSVGPAGDVNYLRATNYLHEALQKNPEGKFRAEALYLLGVSYQGLKDPELWELDNIYFEACIRESPHTEISRKCYRRYADKIHFSYLDIGVNFIPEDEIVRLKELGKLSR